MKIGILGGIGPEATGYFYSTLINKLKKSGFIKKNKDYPQFFINSINAPELISLKVPNSDIQPYIDGIKELAMHKPDFIVMVCNTIHVYRDLIIQKSGFSNILSLRESGKPMTPRQIAAASGVNYNTVRRLVQELLRDGKLVKAGPRGAYSTKQ